MSYAHTNYTYEYYTYNVLMLPTKINIQPDIQTRVVLICIRVFIIGIAIISFDY